MHARRRDARGSGPGRTARCAIHHFVPHGRFPHRSAWTAPPLERARFGRQGTRRLDVLFDPPLDTVPTVRAAMAPIGRLAGRRQAGGCGGLRRGGSGAFPVGGRFAGVPPRGRPPRPGARIP